MKYARLLLFFLVTSAFGQTELPFKQTDGLMLVSMKVDGKMLNLIVDTGAAATMISGDAIGVGGGGNLRPAIAFHVMAGQALRRNVTIEVGQSAFNQPATILSMRNLSDRLGVKCDGILGADFLSNFKIVKIDYKAHTLELVH